MSTGNLPAHKLIPQTGFIVDGFKFRSPLIKAYFLSHAHGDHYTGLRDNWDYGRIYCSEVTGKLIIRILGVNPDLICPLQWDTPTIIEGVEVILVDANHCPGAAQLIFKLPGGGAYLHCGDMRFGPHLLENPHLQGVQGCNAVYLDTTYCNPKYTFPPQEEAVDYVASTIHKLLTAEDGKRRLFLIQTYVIGKEHILIEVFKRCQKKIFLSEKKLGIMECLDMPGLSCTEIFTTNPDATNIHLTQWGWLGESWPFFRPNFKNMERARREMGVDEVVGFCPTGWMYEMKKKTYPVKTKGFSRIHLVPYSEHSSYTELRDYVRFLKPHKVIPTVGVDGEDADKNRIAMLKHFRNLVNETASKASFLAAFSRSDSNKRSEESEDRPDDQSDGDEAEEVQQDTACAALDPPEPSGNLGPDDHGDYDVSKDDAQGNAGNTESRMQIKRMPSELEEKPPAMLTDRDQLEIKASADAMQGDTIIKSEGALQQAIKSETQGSMSQPELSLQTWAKTAGPLFPDQLEQQAEQQPDSAPSTAMAEGLEKQGGNGFVTSTSVGGEARDSMGQLVAILGGELTNEAAAKLLKKCSGNIAQAVNAFYDGTASSQAKQPGQQANLYKPQPSPQAKSTKRKRGPSKTPQAASKQAKLSADQRPITSFFGQGKAQAPSARTSLPSKAGTASHPISLDDEEDPQPSTSSPFARKPQPCEPDRDEPLREVVTRDGDTCADLKGEQEETDREDSAEGKPPEPPASKSKLRLPPAPLFTKNHKVAGSSLAMGGNIKEDGRSNTPMADASLAPPGPQQPQSEAVKQPQVPERSAEVAWDAVLASVKAYDPVAHAIWGSGQPAPYLHVARALAAMDSTTKRLRISDVIANMFRSLLALAPDDILPAAYLVTGKLAPDYEAVEMNVGGSIITSAVIDATGTTKQRMSSMYKDLGDLGDVAQACRHNQSTLRKPAPLTVRGVFKTMKQIAAEKGNGSAMRKQRAVLSLLRSAREEEPKYLVRTLVSNLRVGANWRSVIPGLARAFVLHEKGPGASKAELDAASAKVTEAFHLCPNLDVLVPALREGGLAELERRCTLKAGIPLKPMLAKICEGIPDALRQLKGDFLAEFKYDGQRSQIHLLPNGSVKLFSRNCEDKTLAFPDVVNIVQQAAEGGAKELVMDTELVAVDRVDDNRLRAFQELSTRARGQTELHQVSVQVCVFVFDMLMVDGDVLIKQTLRERRNRIAQALPNMRPGYIQLAQSLQLQPPPSDAKAPMLQADPESAQESVDAEAGDVEAQVQTYLLESFASGTEGLMLKALDTNATYQASKRSESWLKLKRDYCEGLRDSLDLVPIGAWYGQGRKTGWFSPFLLAAWDPEKEEFQSVCRCISGFTDVFYAQATERLGQRRCERKSYYNTRESPSMWFEPGEVWEIRGADLTISPVHRAAIGRLEANPERGVSLRFPRFISVREDKSIEDASSPDVIVDLYNKQTRKMSSAKAMLEVQRKRDKAEDTAQQVESDPDSDLEVPAHEEEAV